METGVEVQIGCFGTLGFGLGLTLETGDCGKIWVGYGTEFEVGVG